MTYDEFNNLKTGDRIIGMTGTYGTVIEHATGWRGVRIGVRVCWDGTNRDSAMAYLASATYWMHWRRAEEEA